MKKPIYATRKLSIGLVSCMLGLAIAAPVVRAEDNIEKEVQTETEQTESELPEVDDKEETTGAEEEIIKNPQNAIIQDNPQTDLGNELAISPETVPEPVKQASVKEPTINPVSPGATEITGRGLVGRNQRKK